MALFKLFLCPKRKFERNDDLDKAYSRLKDAIIDAIRHGVEIIDPTHGLAYGRTGQIGALDTSCFKNTVRFRLLPECCSNR